MTKASISELHAHLRRATAVDHSRLDDSLRAAGMFDDRARYMSYLARLYAFHFDAEAALTEAGAEAVIAWRAAHSGSAAR